MDQQEEWRQYKQYPYWVNNGGRVKRVNPNGKERILKPTEVKGRGYLRIDIVRKPKRIQGLVHVMVAECFIDNPENKPQVDHINQIKSDNCVSNLRWVTNAENQRNITTLRTSNTSGCVGVTSKKYQGKHYSWCVRINVDNKRIAVGHFKEYDEAVKARREAEKKYFGDYCPERE